jgi:hypothetical protein
MTSVDGDLSPCSVVKMDKLGLTETLVSAFELTHLHNPEKQHRYSELYKRNGMDNETILKIHFHR